MFFPKKLILFGILLMLFLLTLSNCKDGQKRPDLTELNESFGYQSASDIEDTISKYYDNEVYQYYTYKLDDDSKSDTIFLREKPKNFEPGLFFTILIKFSSGAKLKHGSSIAFDKLDPVVLKLGKNKLKSEDVFLTEHKGSLYIIISGFKAQCCPRNLSIIKITGNRAKTVFNKGFELESICDSDNDGIFEVTGRSQYYQIFETLSDKNAEIGTYSPYEVYLIKDTPEYSYGLSKSYNEKYYIWAGERYNASIHVLYPNDFGKPSLYNK